MIRYKCGRCGREFTALDLEYMPSIKCPYCGYRVVYKVRPAGRKLLRAI
ncbi:MAG: DNA-directed RNA polymerase subunit P [Hyperthermus sp.]|nr:MAG: DNA-directed RNA polymerase subunit P [Hyperthermus sp.]